MTLPGAECIDDLALDTARGQRADYLWRNRSVVVEVKTLRGDPQEKIDRMVDELSEREDFPVFYGRAPADKVFGHLPDGQHLLGRLHEKVVRSVEAGFRDARRQIINTQKVLGLADALGVLVLLNADIEALDPITVGQFVSKLMVHRQGAGHAVDLVWLISEAHTVEHAQPCILIEHDSLARFEWADAWVAPLNGRWARFNDSALISSAASALADLTWRPAEGPAERPLTNEQRWRANYRCNPYLSELDDEHVQAFGRRAAEDLLPYMVVDRPHRVGILPPEHVMEAWAHFLEEASRRGLDLRGVVS